MLAATISSILLEYGFDTVEKESLGTLTEMLQACMYNILIEAHCTCFCLF